MGAVSSGCSKTARCTSSSRIRVAFEGCLLRFGGGVDTDLDLCLFAHHGRCWVSLLVLRTSVDHRERKRLKTSENVEDRGKEGRVR